MTPSLFSELGLTEPIVRALELAHHTTPTPIQVRAIPLLLSGKDLLGIAQTGTGKTAAFALPLLQHLSETRSRPRPTKTRALILAPTRELAIQIAESLAIYGRHLGLRHTVIVGGVAQGPQCKAMAGGVDILVATPGRLLDLVGQGRVGLDAVSHLVLDEADRMLDMGFIRDVRKIVAAMPVQRQTLLFSATMPKDVERLANDILDDPARIEVTPEAITVDLIDQSVRHVGTGAKSALLTRMLGDPGLARVLVFTRTKRGANRVAEQLAKAGIAADALHGNKSQSARQRALNKFRVGAARVLVATDIAARGIDVDDVTHVINFELPNEPESYVHRIGRTGRAGASGCAVSFCDPSEIGYLRDIERLTGSALAVVGVPRPASERPLQGRTAGSSAKPSKGLHHQHRSAPTVRVGKASGNGLPAFCNLDTAPRKSRQHGHQTIGDPKMPTGTVKWFNSMKGFGFINPDDGDQDVFVHISAVERAGIRILNEGQKLSYDLQRDPKKGRLSAANIKLA